MNRAACQRLQPEDVPREPAHAPPRGQAAEAGSRHLVQRSASIREAPSCEAELAAARKPSTQASSRGTSQDQVSGADSAGTCLQGIAEARAAGKGAPTNLVQRLQIAAAIAPMIRAKGRRTRRVRLLDAAGNVRKTVDTDVLRAALLHRARLEVSHGAPEWRECLVCRFPFVPCRVNQRYCTRVCQSRACKTLCTVCRKGWVRTPREPRCACCKACRRRREMMAHPVGIEPT